MRPPAISDIKTYLKPVIDYAAKNGVEIAAWADTAVAISTQN